MRRLLDGIPWERTMHVAPPPRVPLGTVEPEHSARAERAECDRRGLGPAPRYVARSTALQPASRRGGQSRPSIAHGREPRIADLRGPRVLVARPTPFSCARSGATP